jgi:hypothetical protein
MKATKAAAEQRQRLQFAAQVDSTAAQGFEILAITAGEGNGWQFPAHVLRASLALWESVETFIDHGGCENKMALRSVRDLAGICQNPQWDESHQGIRLRLKPLGPAEGILRSLAKTALADELPAQAIGFSADLLFTASGRQVEKILNVFSVDLVVDPARGGAFLRAFQKSFQTSPKENLPMLEKNTTQTPTPQTPPAVTQELCSYLLETALQAAQLPQAAEERLRLQFAERSFEPADLKQAIADTRNFVSALTAAHTVQGPASRIHGQFTAEDRLQAAVDDLFGAPREEKLQQVRPEHLSGIRELYLLLTGDYDLHGGISPERARFATTADFTGLVKNAMNKVVANTWDELGRAGYDWWQSITRVEHFNTLNQITGSLVGTVGSLPSVSEGAAYTELSVGDSPETATFSKYGGYIPLTLELIDRDETHKLRAYPRELAAAGLRKISSLVAAIFTANSGVGPALADGGALFNATAVTSSGGHANLGTAALSAANWESASQAVYEQPMLVKNAAAYYGTGPAMAVSPRYLLVPRALQLSAMQIRYPNFERAANIYSENQQRGEPGDVITVPDWSDATDWAAVCDPRVAPAIFLGERFGMLPEIFISGQENIGAVFTHDEHRLKVRHFLAVWVNDFRPLYKSNVSDG